jgi:hypothetical protein
VTSKKGAKLLILLAAVVLTIALVLMALESRRTPDWQVSLVRYFEVSEMTLADVGAIWVAEARSVDAFPSEALAAIPTGWTWEDIERIPPPVEARCVRVQWRGSAKLAARIPDTHLVIGYHDDGLHHAGWVVHQFRDTVSESERQERFAAMGCTRWKQVAIGTR